MSPWIPLFQTLVQTFVALLQTMVWPAFIGLLLYYFYGAAKDILHSIAERIRKGSSIKAGPGGVEIGPIPDDLKVLPTAPHPPTLPAHASIAKAETPADWRLDRAKEYARVDGYMLVHVYRPSTDPLQTFDIFLFLVKHKKGSAGPPRRNLDEIANAEFYFGESWGNETFPVSNNGGVIGIRTSAFGTFLACCRVSFKDPNRKPIVLFRYVDFHMLQDNPEPMEAHLDVGRVGFS